MFLEHHNFEVHVVFISFYYRGINNNLHIIPTKEKDIILGKSGSEQNGSLQGNLSVQLERSAG